MFCANVDVAVESVKTLVDNNRCFYCDKIEGERIIYPCGHSYCDDCVDKERHCLFCCPTPPRASHHEPVPDEPATLRAKNAANLLDTFQQAFRVDVYKRKKLSEQLKIEKEVFPECIQAPEKYYNKRKSSGPYKENRESSILPGEHTSPFKGKMENSIDHVERWLEKIQRKYTPHKAPHTPRKPFADLDVNISNTNQTPLKRTIPKRADLILEKAREANEKSAKKKRRLIKSSLPDKDSQPLLDQYWKPTEKGKQFEKIRKEFEDSEKPIRELKNKVDKDESGIVMDDEANVIDDEPIVIDDSQSLVVDKDKLAWLAVLEANEKDPYVSQTPKVESNVIVNNNLIEKGVIHKRNRVPFIKKGYLIETCKLCRDSSSAQNKTAGQSEIVTAGQFELVTAGQSELVTAGQSKDVCITVESKAFVTTIKMFTVQDKYVFGKQSVPTQTDIVGIERPIEEESTITTRKIKHIQDVRRNDQDIMKINQPVHQQAIIEEVKLIKEKSSQDLFTAEVKALESQWIEAINSAPVVISDSDSDDVLNTSSTFEVTAEVHRSSDQLEQSVLKELEESVIQQRGKRAARGHSANSSDSSDKENRDPNRAKRMKLDKKGLKKKYIMV